VRVWGRARGGVTGLETPGCVAVQPRTRAAPTAWQKRGILYKRKPADVRTPERTRGAQVASGGDSQDGSEGKRDLEHHLPEGVPGRN
jgi:hypothetical protein